ncbi:MAG: SpoIIE family protein phosphatase [Anaerolineae bacterium]|jgi:sigma-B regulation protein RsbU (phosphoserine phosphatase)
MTTTDPSQLSSDRLTLLYHLSQTFNSSLDLDEVLNRVMDEIIAAMGAERGFVMLHEDDGGLVFRAARGIDQKTIDEPQFHISRSVVEEVAREGQPLLTSDAQRDSRFSSSQSVRGLRLRSILCAPLKIKDRISGVVYVDNQLRAGIFTEADLELISAIASSAAIAIENARLYQVAIEKGRLERELQVAREVQSSLIPLQTPDIAGWDFAARWKPARQVSGDFYDFVPVDQRLGIVIADVSDKGMPAALFMALSRSIIRASVTSTRSPAEDIDQANRLICADSADSMFVTLFYAQLDPQTGEVVYVNAGHNPPLLYRANEDELIELTRTGMVLGLFETVDFEQRTVQLDPADFILLYTDGVSEAMDAHNREFGRERLRRVLLDNCQAPAEDVAEAIEQALTAFTGEAAPSDDITFVIARRL